MNRPLLKVHLWLRCWTTSFTTGKALKELINPEASTLAPQNIWSVWRTAVGCQYCYTTGVSTEEQVPGTRYCTGNHWFKKNWCTVSTTCRSAFYHVNQRNWEWRDNRFWTKTVNCAPVFNRGSCYKTHSTHETLLCSIRCKAAGFVLCVWPVTLWLQWDTWPQESAVGSSGHAQKTLLPHWPGHKKGHWARQAEPGHVRSLYTHTHTHFHRATTMSSLHSLICSQVVNTLCPLCSFHFSLAEFPSSLSSFHG